MGDKGGQLVSEVVGISELAGGEEKHHLHTSCPANKMEKCDKNILMFKLFAHSHHWYTTSLYQIYFKQALGRTRMIHTFLHLPSSAGDQLRMVLVDKLVVQEDMASGRRSWGCAQLLY